MENEDKELLFRDLCARLPYEVKISKVIDNFISEPHQIRSINLNNIIVEDGEFEDGTPDIDIWDYEDVKPYLFPLSSMTEEQKEFLRQQNWCIAISTNGTIETTIEGFDWLNKNHFDYRGLIPKGLAIDATGLNIY